MILGMSTSTFTFVHTALSLVGIFAGLIVLFGMFSSKRLEGWTAVFLSTTVLTSVTGFFFPVDRILPSHIVGVLSLVVLAVTLAALYIYRLAGAWRWLYVATAVFALYLNVFVGVVQAFGKVPFLNALPLRRRICHSSSHREWCSLSLSTLVSRPCDRFILKLSPAPRAA